MDAKPKTLKILQMVATLLLAVATWMVFAYAPMEVTMGNVQRVFYFHVSAGWLGMISFVLALVAGIAYLKTADRKWDTVGLAGVEVGIYRQSETLLSRGKSVSLNAKVN
ncbi:MAG: hypothetical protein IH859_09760, partial [Chloroflexi bacterium]|nr:hypothetical protein [Chloroflexota bacterium]